MGDMQYEHPQNLHLAEILKSNLQIQELRQQEAGVLLTIKDPNSKEYLDVKAEYLKKTIDAVIPCHDFLVC